MLDGDFKNFPVVMINYLKKKDTNKQMNSIQNLEKKSRRKEQSQQRMRKKSNTDESQ